MSDSAYDRRAFVSGGLVAAGLAAVVGNASASTRPVEGAWRPASEPNDAWLDKPGTRHRLVVDTWTAAAAEQALGYVDTFYRANESGYGLAADALGVVIVLRHFSTPFGYADKVWEKYGGALAELIKLSGRVAIRAAQVNPLLASAPSAGKRGGDEEDPTLTSLAAKGVRFAVCAAATANLAQILAKSGGNAAAIEAELKANLVPGAVLMASGVVAVNRAQEYGYAFMSVVA